MLTESPQFDWANGDGGSKSGGAAGSLWRIAFAAARACQISESRTAIVCACWPSSHDSRKNGGGPLAD